MSRKIIQIDEDTCIGCGLCANACQQSAIQLVDGKAKVVHDDYCDGLGNCLPVCPVGAITFSDRDIVNTGHAPSPAPHSCPGSAQVVFDRTTDLQPSAEVPSQLAQWPVQIKLVAEHAPYFHGADLLVAADCTAFTYGNFHDKFMKDKVTIIGCPKLDQGDYAAKLTEILRNNAIRCVTVARMEVPCCGGLERAVVSALHASGKSIPLQVLTISTKGALLDS